MEIDDIESNLRKFELPPEKILAHLLNLTIQNNAILRTLLNSQVSMISLIDKDIDVERLLKESNQSIENYVSQLQAFFAAK